MLSEPRNPGDGICPNRDGSDVQPEGSTAETATFGKRSAPLPSAASNKSVGALRPQPLVRRMRSPLPEQSSRSEKQSTAARKIRVGIDCSRTVRLPGVRCIKASHISFRAQNFGRARPHIRGMRLLGSGRFSRGRPALAEASLDKFWEAPCSKSKKCLFVLIYPAASVFYHDTALGSGSNCRRASPRPTVLSTRNCFYGRAIPGDVRGQDLCA